MSKQYMAHIEKVGEDHVLVLPEELVEEMGFKDGDTVLWEREEPKEEGGSPVYSFRRIDP